MSNKPFSISVLILGLSLIAVAGIESRDTPVVVQSNLENIPMQIGPYTATEDSFSESVYNELNADKHVYRHYTSPGGRVIDLYIGYYGTAKGGRTGHNPYACLPGAGWAIIKDEEISIKMQQEERLKEIRYVIARKGETLNAMLHWYQSAGTKTLNSGIEQNLHRMFSRILYNKNDGAFVQVSTFTKPAGIDEAKIDIILFAKKVLKQLPRYWPLEEE